MVILDGKDILSESKLLKSEKVHGSMDFIGLLDTVKEDRCSNPKNIHEEIFVIWLLYKFKYSRFLRLEKVFGWILLI